MLVLPLDREARKMSENNANNVKSQSVLLVLYNQAKVRCVARSAGQCRNRSTIITPREPEPYSVPGSVFQNSFVPIKNNISVIFSAFKRSSEASQQPAV